MQEAGFAKLIKRWKKEDAVRQQIEGLSPAVREAFLIQAVAAMSLKIEELEEKLARYR